MLKKILFVLEKIIDFILPPRTNFDIVKNLTEDKIHNLPKPKNLTQMDWVHPLFDYKDKRVKAIIWELKYKENLLPLDIIGRMLFDEILALISDVVLFDSDAKFLLIPIPTTSKNRAERGYNQTELIARSIIQNDNERLLLYSPQWLYKTKDTPRQSHSESKQERTKNLSGCFKADPRIGENIVILIDDVVTTGSTLSEAQSTLLSAGAKNVFAFTIAH